MYSFARVCVNALSVGEGHRDAALRAHVSRTGVSGVMKVYFYSNTALCA